MEQPEIPPNKKHPSTKRGQFCAQINGWGSQDRTGASGSRDRRPTAGPIPNSVEIQ